MTERLPRIVIEAIAHEQHRYPTVGDYFEGSDGWTVRVSRCGDARYEFLVALHELVEWFLTQQRGISEPDILAFDEAFEREREQGMHGEREQPGDDPRAPYGREHRFAERIERLAAGELGVDWDEYDGTIGGLFG